MDTQELESCTNAAAKDKCFYCKITRRILLAFARSADIMNLLRVNVAKMQCFGKDDFRE